MEIERTKPRQKLLAHVRKVFIANGYPRLVVSLILALSGLVAFSFSASALALGLDHIPLRYFAAAIAGYVTFLALIRVWIALHRIGWHVDLPLDGFGVPGHAASDSTAMFGGGSSGGGGASAAWDSAASGASKVDVGIDVDEAWPLLLALAFLLGSLLAMFYVVYAAPVLLAEVALDAALVTGIYRRLRKEDARHWLGSAVRHTWLPALIAALCLYAAGMALQWAAPDARSIGDAVRAVRR